MMPCNKIITTSKLSNDNIEGDKITRENRTCVEIPTVKYIPLDIAK